MDTFFDLWYFDLYNAASVFQSSIQLSLLVYDISRFRRVDCSLSITNKIIIGLLIQTINFDFAEIFRVFCENIGQFFIQLLIWYIRCTRLIYSHCYINYHIKIQNISQVKPIHLPIIFFIQRQNRVKSYEIPSNINLPIKYNGW